MDEQEEINEKADIQVKKTKRSSRGKRSRTYWKRRNEQKKKLSCTMMEIEMILEVSHNDDKKVI